MVVLRPIPVASARPVNLAPRRQTRPVVPMGRNPVPTAAAVPDCAVKGIPILTLVRMATRRVIPGEVRLRPRLRPVLAVLLREPVTKLRRIPTVIAVPAGTAHHVPKDIQQLHPRFALVARYLEPATNAK